MFKKVMIVIVIVVVLAALIFAGYHVSRGVQFTCDFMEYVKDVTGGTPWELHELSHELGTTEWTAIVDVYHADTNSISSWLLEFDYYW